MSGSSPRSQLNSKIDMSRLCYRIARMTHDIFVADIGRFRPVATVVGTEVALTSIRYQFEHVLVCCTGDLHVEHVRNAAEQCALKE